MRSAALIAIGLAAWFATQLIALALAGGGHGWDAPTMLSLLLCLLYPMAFVRALGLQRRMVIVDLSLLAIAVLLDMLLWHNVTSDEQEYFQMVSSQAGGLVGGWFFLWALWQMLAVVAVLRDRPA